MRYLGVYLFCAAVLLQCCYGEVSSQTNVRVRGLHSLVVQSNALANGGASTDDAVASGIRPSMPLLIQRRVLHSNITAPAGPEASNVSTQQTSGSSTTEEDKIAQWHWNWRTELGIVLSGVVAMLTAPGGGSGATLYMPLFNLLIGFDTRQTAVITNFVVFMGAITSTLYAVAEPHPVNPSRPRVDWCSVLVMTPPLLMGVSLGVIMNAVLPLWLLQSATLAAFFWSLFKITCSFWKINKVETKKKKAEEGRNKPSTAAADPGLPGAAKAEASVDDFEAACPRAPRRPSFLARVTAKAAAWWELQPAIVQGLVLVVMAIQMTFSLVSEETTHKCSTTYWALLAATCFLMLLLAVLAVVITRWYSRRWERQQQIKAAAEHLEDGFCAGAADIDILGRAWVEVVVEGEAGAHSDAHACPDAGSADQGRTKSYCVPAGQVKLDRMLSRPLMARACSAPAKVVPADELKPRSAAAAAAAPRGSTTNDYGSSWEAIVWDGRKLTYVPMLMVIVGAVSGCLGLGGGFLVTPMLLGMGLHPQCQAVTSRVILFISTFSTSLLYLIQGRLPLYMGLLHGGINLLLSPVGIWAMDQIIKRTGRPSLMVALNIGRYVVGVTLLLTLSAIPTWIATAQGHLPVGFMMQNFCGVGCSI